MRNGLVLCCPNEFFCKRRIWVFLRKFCGAFCVCVIVSHGACCLRVGGRLRKNSALTHWGTLRVGRLSSGRMTSRLFFVPRHDVLWRCYMCVGVGVEGGDSVFFGLRHLRKAAPLTLPPDAVCPGLLGWKQDRG